MFYLIVFERLDMKSLFLQVLFLFTVLTPNARGEKSDIAKEIQISAEKIERTQDREGHRRIIAKGHAILTKGTLTIKGESIYIDYVNQDDWHGEVNAYSSNSPTTVRQRRDSTDRWIEGESRWVYVNLLHDYAILALHWSAKMRQIVADKTVDESSGEGIAYDMQTDVVDVFSPARSPANAMDATDAKPYVCTGAKYDEILSITKLEPQIAKMFQGVSDRDGNFNPIDVGQPGTRFVLAAASKDAVLVAVERGGRNYSVNLWFFVREGDQWQRGKDLPLSDIPPNSLGELLRDANRSFNCMNLAGSGVVSR